MTTSIEASAAHIFHESANLNGAQCERARMFVESFEYTTCAVAALMFAIRQQYAEHRELGCAAVEGDPMADVLRDCIVTLANLEAKEV